MNNTTLVCKHAPDFTAKAIASDGSIIENFNFKEHTQNKYSVLFFYPLDFTFVCPTEIIAFSNRIDSFNEINTEVIGISVDSHFSHHAWRNTPRDQGGIGEIKFPLVSDITKSISNDYGVLLDSSIALRGTFIVDRNFIVKHQSINDLPIGRNVDETIRLIKAIQFTEEHGEVCPADWNTGKTGMTPDAAGVAEYLANHNENL